MSPLNERLDEIVWEKMPEDGRKFCWAVYRWAQQATVEIDRLKNDVERLEAEANDA